MMKKDNYEALEHMTEAASEKVSEAMDKMEQGAMEGLKAMEEGAVSGYKKIEDGVVSGYKKIEDGVVGSFTKMTDKFVDKFLAHEGETPAHAKERIAAEQAAREASIQEKINKHM